MYLWIKAFHLIFVIALMGGLLIFPRYKLHQMSSAPGEPLFEKMKEASARLRRIILSPALILVWVLGLAMLYLNPSLLQSGWMHVKLFFVVLLTGIHGYFISVGRKIDNGQSGPGVNALKMLNELPFIFLIVIVIMVIVRPF